MLKGEIDKDSKTFHHYQSFLPTSYPKENSQMHRNKIVKA